MLEGTGEAGCFLFGDWPLARRFVTAARSSYRLSLDGTFPLALIV